MPAHSHLVVTRIFERARRLLDRQVVVHRKDPAELARTALPLKVGKLTR
jgi:hypothetical protein